jgi:lysophospholipase L1-like esterase
MLLKGIDVEAGEDAGVVVTLGDSITDGAVSTRDGNARWPDVLAARLHANPATAHLGVLNEGISGNRVIRDGAGVSALARFDRDVLSQSGVKYIIFLEGINDIGITNGPPRPARAGAPPVAPDPMTAADMIWALNQLVMRAHARGIKIYGATLTGFGGAGYQSPEGEKIRLAENNWIRNGGAVDGVIDFSKTTKDPSVTDPSMPEKYLPAYDSGDHLHPNDTGYKAMGDSIDLKLFTK